jgi:SAM-dependent methyltransferase
MYLGDSSPPARCAYGKKREVSTTGPSAASTFLDEWAAGLLAHPVTKAPATPNDFRFVNGVLDARVFLRNTFGFREWFVGQARYEIGEAVGKGYENKVESYKREVEYDRPTYDHFRIAGDVLDVGGGVGTVREFLSEGTRFISIDPSIDAPFRVTKPKLEAYKCLARKLNFVCGSGEFLPFRSESFDWIHMRSMLDHVQIPDLVLMEAHRVLRPDGSLLVGLYVEGGKSGKKPLVRLLKDAARQALELIGVEKYKDFHMWHPRYAQLLKLIGDNGFRVRDAYWQPHWKDQVVYVSAQKQ